MDQTKLLSDALKVLKVEDSSSIISSNSDLNVKTKDGQTLKCFIPAATYIGKICANDGFIGHTKEEQACVYQWLEYCLLHSNNKDKNISSDNCCDTSLFPDFSFLRCIIPNNILSITVGPFHAYTDVKIKNVDRSETLIFLFNNVDMTDLFIEYCNSFYNISPVYVLHPFVNNILMFESIYARLPMSNISFQNHILFSQRVLVSKVLHKCHYGILHYVFITPSHIVLVEERLHIPQVVGLDTTVQPQFHICALVSIHTNIKQIHLKDIDDERNLNQGESELSNLKQDSLVENKHLEVLYKCGSWLIIEFESSVILYLKFFSLKQRNEFLDAFLCARSQR